MASAGTVKIDALKALLDSAREIVADLGGGSLERALTAWRANEAFAPLHKVQMRANPHAQLFVRVFDPVPEPSFAQTDIVPETLRLMKRLGVLIHPEALAIWQPAV